MKVAGGPSAGRRQREQREQAARSVRLGSGKRGHNLADHAVKGAAYSTECSTKLALKKDAPKRQVPPGTTKQRRQGLT